MNSKNKLLSIVKQLDSQNILYEILSDQELQNIELKWKDKFIDKKTAPDLDKFKWHIFSFSRDMKI